jgi:hypothetical protein
MRSRHIDRAKKYLSVLSVNALFLVCFVAHAMHVIPANASHIFVEDRIQFTGRTIVEPAVDEAAIKLPDGHGLFAATSMLRTYRVAMVDSASCPPYICFTSEEWAYYTTVWQIYDEYALCYHFGEIGHIGVGDTLRELFFHDFREGEWITPYDSLAYTDTIRSMVFRGNSGDTIQFWHDLDIQYKDGVIPFEDVQFADTLEYVIDLVSAMTGDIISNLQSTRLYPEETVGDLMLQMADSWYEADGFMGEAGSGQPDTTRALLIRRIIPDGVEDEDVFVRLTPVFKGPLNERGLWRLGRGMARRSMEMEAYTAFFRAVYDSLLAVGDTLPRVPSRMLDENSMKRQANIEIWPNPANDRVYVSYTAGDYTGPVSITLSGAGNGVVYYRHHFEPGTGKRMIEIDVSSLSAGPYFVVLTGDNLFLRHQMISIN